MARKANVVANAVVANAVVANAVAANAVVADAVVANVANVVADAVAKIKEEVPNIIVNVELNVIVVNYVSVKKGAKDVKK